MACSNSTADKLVTKLGEIVYGEPMLRRLIDLPHGLLIDFHTNSSYVNRQKHQVIGNTLRVVAGQVFQLANLPNSGLTTPVQQPINWKYVPKAAPQGKYQSLPRHSSSAVSAAAVVAAVTSGAAIPGNPVRVDSNESANKTDPKQAPPKRRKVVPIGKKHLNSQSESE